ncbi:peroxiredoxin-like family protein [Paenibacillus filicis]|uniref:thioredoxin-dependent peroxiredoxin n=2 Tax=Paenibacillus gyeongsangnamensis TaxID=3388067 RepID=A0ABT4Q401_9BACL|nr:peroxiredoxin-like family protein [Paenibacillus filicis]MCZ8511605.1 peroxiredoxin-like family protein [Paenibacillus filicis]
MTTKLLDEIQQYQDNFRKKAPIETQKLMEQATKELSESNIAKGLTVGEQAPDFTLKDATGASISLYEELKKGPVILTFYRGAWCPYCNLELNAYQRVLKDIKATGGQLIAVSPQTPDASLTMKEKNELEFLVLSDPDGIVAGNYNLVFKLPDYIIEIYKGFGLDIPGHNGNDTWELPVPATYVIDRSGKIRFASVDPDYTKREEPSRMVELLKEVL